MHRLARWSAAAGLFAVVSLNALSPVLGFSPAVRLRVAGRHGAVSRAASLRKAHVRVSPLRASAEPVGEAPAVATPDTGNKPTRHFTAGGDAVKPFRIVLIAGFEASNREHPCKSRRVLVACGSTPL